MNNGSTNLSISVVLSEYKDEIHRLRIQHVILRQLVIDQLAINRGISRNQAEAMVDMELFNQMQREERL